MGNKFKSELCNDKMTFEECELTILRHSVDETTEIQGKRVVNSEDIKRMITILENFLMDKKLICYGGTAINNILPKSAQFYNRDIEIPDYDFFSKNALNDTKELSDIFFNEGFTDVEAKSGVHKGTYKVFVNFIPIADITSLYPDIYDNLGKEAITILGIRYCPPNYLRMSMYLELSRPAGDVSRWEKVLKRLTLLNKYYPIKPEIDCKKVKKEPLEKKEKKSKKERSKYESGEKKEEKENVYSIIKSSFIDEGVVFFGGYATYLYSEYMPKNVQNIVTNLEIFDVLSETPDKSAMMIKERLENAGIKNVKEVKHNAFEDIIPENVEIKVNNKTYAFIYKPIACHNYNVVTINQEKVNIATIDTMLSFYLAFIYVNDKNYNKDRILCIAKYLFELEQHNRLSQNSILKRFSTECYGVQKGLTSIRAEKAEMFKKLSKDRGSKEYEEWFLKYVPSQQSKNEKEKHSKKVEKYVKQVDKKIEEEEKEGITLTDKNKKVEEENEIAVQEIQKDIMKKRSLDKDIKSKKFAKFRSAIKKKRNTQKKKKSLLSKFFGKKTKKGLFF
jgi:hypothetical protein